MKKLPLLLGIILVFGSTSALAQRTSDVRNGRDYRLVSRFKGSVIEWYQHKAFDKYFLLEKKGRKLVPKRVEGEVTRIQYSTGKDHSIVEIVRSYEVALKAAGFNVTVSLNENNGPSNLNEELYFAEFNGLNKLPSGSIKPDHNGKWSYLEAMGEKNGKSIYIVLYVTDRGYPLITFDAIETKKMEAGLVTAHSIDKGISAAGHVVLAGLFFDTGKSTIKPESRAALKNIAAYLKAHKERRFLIVGHTDNVGDFESNIRLSKARAVSVAKTLTGRYGIPSGQVMPYGVGFAAPVASNADESGRERNRRVELVER